ncbi:unnamed protein product [Protopolystoma xenopodis]|uniref:Uncharacterized protein n=1 Tax=Protopolystoma xenopodis TaxID=117903 RepID=A0A448WEY1_9PLAT|nr:unnamed protein product [Protopolystoma xenopodis]
MSSFKVEQEKIDLQKSLLYFERLYGRPKDAESKRIMKPLYDRYRQVKRLVQARRARRLAAGNLCKAGADIHLPPLNSRHQPANLACANPSFLPLSPPSSHSAIPSVLKPSPSIAVRLPPLVSTTTFLPPPLTSEQRQQQQRWSPEAEVHLPQPWSDLEVIPPLPVQVYLLA